MDSCQKEVESSSPCSETASEMNKYCCSNCKTTKTPMWRTGPSGPKSLCNACGIRYRKKRPVAAGAVVAIAKNGSVEKGKIEKRRNMMEKEGVLMKKKKKKKGQRLRQWDEVERAALLLMALSCGAIFA